MDIHVLRHWLRQPSFHDFEKTMAILVHALQFVSVKLSIVFLAFSFERQVILEFFDFLHALAQLLGILFIDLFNLLDAMYLCGCPCLPKIALLLQLDKKTILFGACTIVLPRIEEQGIDESTVYNAKGLGHVGGVDIPTYRFGISVVAGIVRNVWSKIILQQGLEILEHHPMKIIHR